MRTLIGMTLVMATLAMSGCVKNHVIRDRTAWETEAAFVNNLVVAEQTAISDLMERSCRCDANAFRTHLPNMRSNPIFGRRPFSSAPS